MPRTKQQLEKLKQERKEKILNAACILFAEKGYKTTSVAEIAKQANISKGLIYNYFASKEDILRNILAMGFDLYDKAFETIADKEPTKENLMLLVDRLAQMAIENRELTGLFYMIFSQKSVLEIAMPEMEEQLAKYTGFLGQYFARCTEPQLIQTKVMSFIAALDGIAMYFVLMPDLDIKALYKYTAEKLLDC